MQRTKTDWRRQLLQARGRLEPGLRRLHSAAIVDRIAALPAFSTASALLLYIPLGAEADPRDLATLHSASGRAVYVPGDAVGMWLAYPCSAAPEAPPVTSSCAALPSPVLAVVPGLGFDLAGVRLGRGRGFYDRALRALRERVSVVALGIAFELQIVARLPRDPWDEPVDLIVTEQRLLAPGNDDNPRAARSTVEEVRES